MAVLEFRFASGRAARASALLVESTYAGLLEGLPSREMNDRLLSVLVGRVQSIFGDWPVHVIEPPRRTGEDRRGRGPVERLPDCWVAADFTASPIDSAMDGSRLILVWFQETAFPMPADAILAQLRGVDWEGLARDFEF